LKGIVAKTVAKFQRLRPAIESQAKIPTKRKIILRNFKCEKKEHRNKPFRLNGGNI
jgi:hypothetical protein